MALTRQEILSADDITLKEVEVPEWGGSVFIRPMTGSERDRYESDILGEDGKSDVRNKSLREKLAVLSVCDESGATLFTEEDIQALSEKNSAPLDRIFDAAQKLNGITDDDIKILTKNSDSGQS